MMGLFNLSKSSTSSVVKMVTERAPNFYAWNGKVYQSDIVRSCVRPAALLASKLEAKHIRETYKDGKMSTEVNPEPYMRMLLQEPNAMMSMAKLLEKLMIQWKINNNAFALVVRDAAGFPTQIIPIDCYEAEAVYSTAGDLCLRFYLTDGRQYIFDYRDIIHLRKDFSGSEIFGAPNIEALRSLMDIVGTTDQGIVKTIKNSSVIRWLLKFTTSTRPEDIKKRTDTFASSFLNIENGTGVAGVDAKEDAIQIHPDDYVPNAAQMDRTTSRLYAYFGVNEKIVQNKANEDEMNAYYEGDVEPFVVDAREEFTRKLFSRHQRGFGNKIVFDAGLINASSIKTKLSYLAMVDRGALSPNEWRRAMNLAPIAGGDEPIRRLDTAPVSGEGGS